MLDGREGAKAQVLPVAPASYRAAARSPKPAPLPKKRNQRFWRQDEVRWLQQNYPAKSVVECAKHLGRSKASVKGYIYNNEGLFFRDKPKRRFWTYPEIDFLNDHYPVMGAQWCAEMLSRSYMSVVSQAGMLGLSLWQPDESRIEGIKEACLVEDSEDGCWLWNGRVSATGVPVATGNHNLSLRLRVWRLANPGKTLRKGRLVLTSCGQQNCLNPEHLVSQSWRTMNLMLARKRDSKLGAVRGRQTRLARGDYILDWDKADSIRASRETNAVLAERYGVSKSTISSIRSGRSWVRAHWGVAVPASRASL